MRPTCAQGLKEGVSVPSRFVHWESNRAWVYRVGQPTRGQSAPAAAWREPTSPLWFVHWDSSRSGFRGHLHAAQADPGSSGLSSALSSLSHLTSQEPWDTAFTTSSPGVRRGPAGRISSPLIGHLTPLSLRCSYTDRGRGGGSVESLVGEVNGGHQYHCYGSYTN